MSILKKGATSNAISRFTARHTFCCTLVPYRATAAMSTSAKADKAASSTQANTTAPRAIAIVSSVGHGGGPVPLSLRLAGTGMLLLVLLLWVGGCSIPLVVVYCVLHGGKICTAIAGLLLLATAYPYLMHPSPWPQFRHAIATLGQYYHQEARMHFESPMLEGGADGEPAEIKVTHPTIACFHPHGIFCQGYILNAGFRPEMKAMPGLLANALYHAPIFRWVIGSWTDACKPASKDSMLRLMRKGESFGLIPGGFEEAAIFKMGVEKVFIKSRKGFVKYALQYGYRLMPVYTFGEVDTYYNIPGFYKLRARLAAHHIPVVMPIGCWWCPLLPKPSRVNTVYAPPMDLPKIDQPTPAQVDEWHGKYVAALEALFDRNKARFASDPKAKLEVW